MAGFDDFEMGERDEELKSYSNEKQNEYTELESEYSKLYDDYHMPWRRAKTENSPVLKILSPHMECRTKGAKAFFKSKLTSSKTLSARRNCKSTQLEEDREFQQEDSISWIQKLKQWLKDNLALTLAPGIGR